MKITPRDLFSNIEIQSDVKICWVKECDFDFVRYGLEQDEKLLDLEILYMYQDGPYIFLEVVEPEDDLIKNERTVQYFT